MCRGCIAGPTGAVDAEPDVWAESKQRTEEERREANVQTPTGEGMEKGFANNTRRRNVQVQVQVKEAKSGAGCRCKTQDSRR